MFDNQRNIVFDNIFGIFTTLIVIFLTYATYSYYETYSFWSKRGIKGPTPLPFFGNSSTYMLNSVADMDIKNRSIYGRIYGIYDGYNPILVISDPEINEKVLITDHNNFKYHINTVSDDPMVMNVLQMKRGADVKRIRNIFTSSMTPNKLKSYLTMIKTDDLINHVNNIEGQEVKIYEIVSIHMLNTLIQIFYGLDLDLFNNLNHEMIHHSKHLFDWFNACQSFCSSRALWLYNLLYPDYSPAANLYVEQLVKFAINERIKLMNENIFENEIFKREDFIQQFIESKDMTDIEKHANAILALGAGFDTTSFTISFMLYELASQEHILKRLRHEVDDILKDIPNIENVENVENFENVENIPKIGINIPFEALQKMKYLECVFYETLRLHPADIRNYRQSSSAETLIPTTNITIPANISIHTAVYAMHYDPNIYLRPYDFDPDRWSDDRKGSIKSSNFMSFGAGPRMCPGALFALVNVKIVIINLIQRFNFEIIKDKTSLIIEKSRLQSEPRNIFIKFHRRQQTASTLIIDAESN